MAALCHLKVEIAAETGVERVSANQPLVLALPKGRILKEVKPMLADAGIKPEPAFDDPNARQLRFSTNIYDLSIIRVRSFDVPTFVAFGAAQLGVVGNDVLMEFDYNDIYSPLDLGIGRCRMTSHRLPGTSLLTTWSTLETMEMVRREVLTPMLRCQSPSPPLRTGRLATHSNRWLLDPSDSCSGQKL